jgi:hypothetical protein
MHTVIPDSSPGVVEVPLLGGPHAVLEDGQLVWDGAHAVGDAQVTRDGDYVAIGGVAGSHTFTWG